MGQSNQSERTALYRAFDADERLLYVGISKSALRRIGEHASTKLWWNTVTNVTVEWHESRDAAERSEREAIREEYPIHNVQHKPCATSEARAFRVAPFERQLALMDCCTRCSRAHLREGAYDSRRTPIDLHVDDHGVLADYECDECGDYWTCGWSLGFVMTEDLGEDIPIACRDDVWGQPYQQLRGFFT